MNLIGWPTSGVAHFPARNRMYNGYQFIAGGKPAIDTVTPAGQTPAGHNHYLFNIAAAINERRKIITDEGLATLPVFSKLCATLTKDPSRPLANYYKLLQWYRKEIETVGSFFVLVKHPLVPRGQDTGGWPPVYTWLQSIDDTARAVRSGAGYGFSIPAGGSCESSPLPFAGNVSDSPPPPGEAPAQGWLLGKRAGGTPVFAPSETDDWRPLLDQPMAAYAQFFNELMYYLNLCAVLQYPSVEVAYYHGTGGVVPADGCETAQEAAELAYSRAVDNAELIDTDQGSPGGAFTVSAIEGGSTAGADVQYYVPSNDDRKYLVSVTDRDELPIVEHELAFKTKAQLQSVPTFAQLHVSDTNKWELHRTCELICKQHTFLFRDSHLDFHMP